MADGFITTPSARERRAAALRASNAARKVSLTGRTFSRWSVLEEAPPRRVKHAVYAYYRCRCACGTEEEVRAATLRNGTSRSCGCLKLEAFAASGRWDAVDHSEKTFGLLTALFRAPPTGKTKQAEWLCRCACGREAVVPSYWLVSGNTTSCGCKKGRWDTPDQRRAKKNAVHCRRRATLLRAYKPFDPAGLARLERAMRAEASRLTRETGTHHAVDHIVPLIGPYSAELGCRLVCGLHNEHNLQILTREANAAKGNRRWPGMAEAK